MMYGRQAAGMFGFAAPAREIAEGAAALDGAEPLVPRRTFGRQLDIFYPETVIFALNIANLTTLFFASVGNATTENNWAYLTLGLFAAILAAGLESIWRGAAHIISHLPTGVDDEPAIHHFNWTTRLFWLSEPLLLTWSALTLAQATSVNSTLIISVCSFVLFWGAVRHLINSPPLVFDAPPQLPTFPHAAEFYTLPHRTEAMKLMRFIQDANREEIERLHSLLNAAEILTVDTLKLACLNCPILLDIPLNHAATIWAPQVAGSLPIPMGPPPMGTTFDAESLLQAYHAGLAQRAASPAAERHDTNPWARHLTTNVPYMPEQVRGPHPDWRLFYEAFAALACRADVQEVIGAASTRPVAAAMGGGRAVIVEMDSAA